MSAGRAAAACLAWALAAVAWAAPAATTPVADVTGANAATMTAGEAIYLHGRLAAGAQLVAVRGDRGLSAQGSDAACVKCHLRSGLGAKEGLEIIPPVTGRYLFHSRNATFDEVELPYVETARANRAAYTDVTLARAIRDGIDSDGNTLSPLMPRYALRDADMSALIAYLRLMGAGDVPGVTAKVLHFATIITPDADPVKRGGMLDVMQHYFADKNTFPFPPSPPMRSSAKTLYVKSMYMAQRHWQLHVWELTGPAATWSAQLNRLLAAEPVMAAVSGLGGSNWAPVHEFCERSRLPCLFPNVEAPPQDPADFYSLYFSRGVFLEADLIAARILEARAAADGAHGARVLQFFRSGDSGAPAAAALAANLQRHGVAVQNDALAADASPQRIATALGRTAAGDTVVLWLRGPDVANLGGVPTGLDAVYLSGLMGGLEHTPVPAAWRSRARIAFPFDLPDRSRVRVGWPLRWFGIKKIPVVAEQVQVDTYLACGLLAETVGHMADVFAREYLVERAETMIDHRLMTGPYPRLTLAEGQRFASKGGYVLQFADAEGTQLSADRDWTVPEEYSLQ